jgi:hypothetical protein
MYLRKIEQGFVAGSVSLQKESLEAFPVDVGVMQHVTSVNLSNNFIVTVSAAAMHMCVASALLFCSLDPSPYRHSLDAVHTYTSCVLSLVMQVFLPVARPRE